MILPSGRQARALEAEDLLHRDHLAFHAGDFGDRHHPARAVLQAAGLHDQVHGAGDLARTALIGISIPDMATMFSRR
jgi:hypothetical protein